MKNSLLRVFHVVALAVCAACLSGCAIGLFPGRYSSPEMKARVVTPTGEPVADAIVVATWGITGYINDAPLGQLAISEVVTDKNGEFRIPP